MGPEAKFLKFAAVVGIILTAAVGLYTSCEAPQLTMIHAVGDAWAIWVMARIFRKIDAKRD
jgi:hypothetical protein